MNLTPNERRGAHVRAKARIHRLQSMPVTERVPACESGWEPGDGKIVAWLIVFVFAFGALAGAVAP